VVRSETNVSESAEDYTLCCGKDNEVYQLWTAFFVHKVSMTH